MTVNGGGASQLVKAVLNALGTRYLVEHAQSEDGSWSYDRYSDGWVELQGYTTNSIGTGDVTVQLPVELASSDYYVNWRCRTKTSYNEAYLSKASNQTQNAFTITDYMIYGSDKIYWEAKGFAA